MMHNISFLKKALIFILPYLIKDAIQIRLDSMEKDMDSMKKENESLKSLAHNFLDRLIRLHSGSSSTSEAANHTLLSNKIRELERKVSGEINFVVIKNIYSLSLI